MMTPEFRFRLLHLSKNNAMVELGLMMNGEDSVQAQMPIS